MVKDRSRPLIVEWSASARGDLAVRMKSGLVAVHYVGCAMEVLDTCTVSGAYRYVAFSPKEDRLSIRDVRDLYVNLPIGAAGLEAKLLSRGELDLGMTVVGKYEANKAIVHPSDLQGDCGAATHVVTGMTAGAFELSAGGKAEGSAGASFMNARAGARSIDARETLSRDGDPSACGRAADGDTQPPGWCSAIVRVEVVPLSLPECPDGSRRDGERCVAKRDATLDVECPYGAVWNGERCMATRVVMTEVECPRGAVWDGAVCEGRMSPSPTLPVERATPSALLASAKPGTKESVSLAAIELELAKRQTRPDAQAASREPPPPPCDGGSEVECIQRCEAGSAPSCLLLAHREDAPMPAGSRVHPAATVWWFLEACLDGSAEGCSRVGRAYEDGRLGDPDGLSAIKWYRKACGQGDAAACASLRRLNDR